jgi:glycosyltransferase involved in cell wall biosynthesis
LHQEGKIIIYAPGIYSGGGLVVLKQIINFSKVNDFTLILDIRVDLDEKNISKSKVMRIKSSISYRIFYELKLFLFSNKKDHLICISNIPPLFGFKGKVSVFQQNALLLDRALWKLFPFKSKLKFFLQWLVLGLLKSNVDEFLVQTEFMKGALAKRLGSSRFLHPRYIINVLNFAKTDLPVIAYSEHKKKWDFLYVADDQPHKNHKKLIEALIFLKNENIQVTLALTLDNTSRNYSEIAYQVNKHGLQVFFIGRLTRGEIYSAYRNSSCLVYPSLIESLGLPLLEAYSLSLPIIASELDYVYEVITPNYTFGPYSATSIARAIKRQMRINSSKYINKIGINFVDYFNNIRIINYFIKS